MLAYAKELAEKRTLTINTTEIVTHSVLSQTAHNRAGYNKITGFGFCQYPNVFFKNHPESCLWITEIDGRVADALRSCRPVNFQKQLIIESELQLDERELFQSLSHTRNVFIPAIYRDLAANILNQFSDVLDYRINLRAIDSASNVQHQRTELDISGDAPYAYLSLPTGLYKSWEEDLDDQIALIKKNGKRFIQARIPANNSSSITYANHLLSKGFVFLGLLPLFSVPRINSKTFSAYNGSHHI